MSNLLFLSLVLLGSDPATAADEVTLRDGTTVLGQVLPERGRTLSVVVRRDWAEQNIPEHLERWRKAEEPKRAKARAERRSRLEAWKRERMAQPGPADRIAEAIERELARLEQADGEPPLILAALDRRQVASIEERPEASKRMLRQGWLAGFDDVETMPLERLRGGLEARGFALSDIDPAPIDALLPLPIETDRRWLARRASTEVLDDPGLHYLRFGELVLPEGAGMGQADAPLAAAAMSTLRNLLGEPKVGDPLSPTFRRAEQSQRIGLMVTVLELAPDFSWSRVDALLYVRTGPQRWEIAARRSATVRPGELRPDAGAPLAQDPQVQAAFRVIEQLGLGAIDPQLKELSLNIGAATRQALHQSRSELDQDLQSASLRFESPVGP